MRDRLTKAYGWTLGATLLLFLWNDGYAQPRFYGLGFLPDDTGSAATAVSDNAVVVGYGDRWAFSGILLRECARWNSPTREQLSLMRSLRTAWW
jgi:hypothetical protein